MRFKSLEVRNFKAIDYVALDNLADFILIAGPNGCGKSCILDAIRLLKSAYGGYQPNEFEQWLGEFQINFNDQHEISKLFRNGGVPIRISARVELLPSELEFISKNLEAIISPLVWRQVTGQARMARKSGTGDQIKAWSAQVRPQVDEWAGRVRAELDQANDLLQLDVSTDGGFTITSNPVLDLVFQTYDPANIGVVDFHSANRSYQREPLGGIDLNSSTEEVYASQALYNSQARFQQIKTQLASTYIRELLNREAGVGLAEPDLNSTVKELFRTFFPDKEYLGVVPEAGGKLSFPIRTAAGIHDINELSSGEKEIVYGYLRLRTSAPRNSTILLDEPELHLNPSLLREMPAFYHRHLGKAFSNQLWLVTHSDALLRHAVGNSSYSVFHMSPAVGPDVNQVSEVAIDSELERATVALVGDLATYQPRSRVLLFEGEGDADFDVTMAQRLFPQAAKRVNMLGSGSKRRARDLYEVLSRTASSAGMPNRFFVVVDRDSDVTSQDLTNARKFAWDRYHIENYLLSETHIMRAADEIAPSPPFDSLEAVTNALRECARLVAPTVISRRLRDEVNAELRRSLNLGGNPRQELGPVSILRPALEASFQRLREAEQSLIVAGRLEETERRIEAEVRESIDRDNWRTEIPGREILKRFVGAHLKGVINYEAFRFLIIARMAEDDHHPEGMSKILDQILTSTVD